MISTNLYFNLGDFEKTPTAQNDFADKEKTSEDFAALLTLPVAQNTNTAPTEIAAPETIVQEKPAFEFVQNVQSNQIAVSPIFPSTNKKQTADFAFPVEQISKNIKMESENITARNPLPFSPEQIFKTKSDRQNDYIPIIATENVEREDVTIPIFQNPNELEVVTETQIPVENIEPKIAAENQIPVGTVETKFAPIKSAPVKPYSLQNIKPKDQTLFEKIETKSLPENQISFEKIETKTAPRLFEKTDLNVALIHSESLEINAEKSDAPKSYVQEFENFLTVVSTDFINTEIESSTLATKQIAEPNFSLPIEAKNENTVQILSVEGFSKPEIKLRENFFGDFKTANYIETNYRLDFTNTATKPKNVEPMILLENEPTNSELPLETQSSVTPKTTFETETPFEPKASFEAQNAFEFEATFQAKTQFESKVTFEYKTPTDSKIPFEPKKSFENEIAENTQPLFERENYFFETADFSNSKPQSNKFDGFVKLFPEINLTGERQNPGEVKSKVKGVPAQIFNQPETEKSDVVEKSDAVQKTNFDSPVVADATVSESVKPVEAKLKSEAKNDFAPTMQDVKVVEGKTSLASGQQNGFADAEKEFTSLEKTANEKRIKTETNSAEQIFDNFLKSEIKIASGEQIGSLSANDLKSSVFAQIEPRVLELAKDGISPVEKKVLRIKLNPEELGAVEITLHKSESGVVSAHFKTESDASSQVIKESLDQLRSSLENSGIKVGELNISNGSSSNDNASRENQPQHFDTNGKHSVALSNADGNFINKQEDDLNRLVNLRA